MSEFLFAYGTLHADLAPSEIAPVVARLQWAGEGSVAGTLYDFGRFPGLVLDADSIGRVYGTIYELPGDARVLDALDEYEEFDPASPEASQFVRRECAVTRTDGGSVRCWVYTYNRSTATAPVLPGGRYGERGCGTV